jgi:outer membrane protein OmpA-like peptidoglycan-associated protein
VDASGCPKDSDGDGVIDCLDKCADTRRGCTVDASGCAPDADGDGVCDGADKCPGTVKGCAVDSTGCAKDADGDGVCDGADKCPSTAKGCTVDASGCPKDADADGVCDGLDRCPGTPAGRKVDEKGCELAFDERGTLHLEGVNFAFDSDQLTPESKSILDGVAASLKEWSELRVEVGGHTDARGADAYNEKLSQRRADAVRNYLVGKGIPASRLTAKGYGESVPKADNETEAGRSRNRRVELKRLN